MKHLLSKWDGQFMQQEHLQKDSKWQWYCWSDRWHRTLRPIIRIAKNAKYRQTQRSRPESGHCKSLNTPLLVQPLATFILQSLPSAVPKLAMGAAMFVLVVLSVSGTGCEAMICHGVTWQGHLLAKSASPPFFCCLSCYWQLLSVPILLKRTDIGWHWYLGSVLAHS